MSAPQSEQSGGLADPAVHAAASKALELISDGARVGLGSGRAVAVFIAKLGERVREGIRIQCVCASSASAVAARSAGLRVDELAEIGSLDLTVDGADEVAPNLDLLKGRGGAMVRERIVAASAKRQVVIVGEDKLVAALGERGAIPLEVIPMARRLVMQKVEALGLAPRLRLDPTGSRAFTSDNGNHIIDCALSAPIPAADDLRALERALLDIVGVVDTGLFLGTAHAVIVGRADGKVEELVRGMGVTP